MSKTIKILLVILLIVGLVYLVLFTLGRKETIQNDKPREFKEDRDAAKKRYEAFKLVLNSRKKLKKNLDFQYSVIYFIARLGILIIWGLPLLLFFIFGLVVSLNGVAIYITISAVLFAGLYFLTTGKAFNFSDFNDVLQIRIKNWVYGKHINIDENITRDEFLLNNQKKQQIKLNN